MKIKKLLLCVLAVAMVLTSVPVTVFANSTDNNALVVTAVGDSIGRGNGCADVVGITDMPSEYAYGAVFSLLLAEETGNTVIFRNYSADGNRASHVMNDIETNNTVYDVNDIGVADAIRESDILLVSLGGNEIFNGLVNDWLRTLFHAETIDDVLPGIENGSITISDILSKLVLPLIAIHEESELSADLRVIMEANLESTYQTYDAMLKQFFALNSHMRIILNGIPNPLLEDTADEAAYNLLNNPLTYIVDKYNEILIRLTEENSERVFYSDSNRVFSSYDGEGSPSRFKINLSDFLNRFSSGEFNDATGAFDMNLLSAYISNPEYFNIDPHPSEIGQQLLAENTLKIYAEFAAHGSENDGKEESTQPSAQEKDPATKDASANNISVSNSMTSPETGSNSIYTLTGAMLIACALLLCCAAFYSRKRSA